MRIPNGRRYIVDVLLGVRGGTDGVPFSPCAWRKVSGERGELLAAGGRPGIVPVTLEMVEAVTSLRWAFLAFCIVYQNQNLTPGYQTGTNSNADATLDQCSNNGFRRLTME